MFARSFYLLRLRHQHARVAQPRLLDRLLQRLVVRVDAVAVIEPQRAQIVRHAEPEDVDATLRLALIWFVQPHVATHETIPLTLSRMNGKEYDHDSPMSIFSLRERRLETERGMISGDESTR